MLLPSRLSTKNNDLIIIDLLNISKQNSAIFNAYLKQTPPNKVCCACQEATNETDNICEINFNGETYKFILQKNQRVFPYKDNKFLLVVDDKNIQGCSGKILFPSKIIEIGVDYLSITEEEAEKLIIKIPHDIEDINDPDFSEENQIKKEVNIAKIAYADLQLLEPFINFYIKDNKEKFFAILPRFSGLNLAQYIDSDKYIHVSYEKRLTSIVIPLCNAIAALHKKNIMHNDIKLENIIFDEQNNLYLIDFGASSNLDDYTKEKKQQIINEEFELLILNINCILRESYPDAKMFHYCNSYIYPYLFANQSQFNIQNYLKDLQNFSNLQPASANFFSNDQLMNCSNDKREFLVCKNIESNILATVAGMKATILEQFKIALLTLELTKLKLFFNNFNQIYYLLRTFSRFPTTPNFVISLINNEKAFKSLMSCNAQFVKVLNDSITNQTFAKDKIKCLEFMSNTYNKLLQLPEGKLVEFTHLSIEEMRQSLNNLCLEPKNDAQYDKNDIAASPFILFGSSTRPSSNSIDDNNFNEPDYDCAAL